MHACKPGTHPDLQLHEELPPHKLLRLLADQPQLALSVIAQAAPQACIAFRRQVMAQHIQWRRHRHGRLIALCFWHCLLQLLI